MKLSPQIASVIDPICIAIKNTSFLLKNSGVTDVWLVVYLSGYDKFTGYEHDLLGIACSLEEAESFVDDRDKRLRLENPREGIIVAFSKPNLDKEEAEKQLQAFKDKQYDHHITFIKKVCAQEKIDFSLSFKASVGLEDGEFQLLSGEPNIEAY